VSSQTRASLGIMTVLTSGFFNRYVPGDEPGIVL
jgi:hypothetical protein